jgi:DNA-binding IclR family transcriptional regulator
MESSRRVSRELGHIELPEVAGAQVLVRALNLLFTLREEDEAIPVTELGRRLNIPQSNLYRLLQTLENAGLVDRDVRGEVQLGLRLLELGNSVLARIHREVVPAASPVMRALTDRTQQTSLLTMRAGLSALCVHVVESPQPIHLSFAPGRLLPLLGGASGRVLLPWLPDRVLNSLLDRTGSKRSGDAEHLGDGDLETFIGQARRDGYVMTRGEIDPGAAAVAAPVLLGDGRLWAGLSIAGPVEQFPADQIPTLVTEVREHARQLSAAVTEQLTPAR